MPEGFSVSSPLPPKTGRRWGNLRLGQDLDATDFFEGRVYTLIAVIGFAISVKG